MTKKKQPSAKTQKDTKVRRDRIGRQLKKLYDDVASEPVPDDFLRLLENADDASESDGVEGRGS